MLVLKITLSLFLIVPFLIGIASIIRIFLPVASDNSNFIYHAFYNFIETLSFDSKRVGDVSISKDIEDFDKNFKDDVKYKIGKISEAYTDIKIFTESEIEKITNNINTTIENKVSDIKKVYENSKTDIDKITDDIVSVIENKISDVKKEFEDTKNDISKQINDINTKVDNLKVGIETDIINKLQNNVQKTEENKPQE